MSDIEHNRAARSRVEALISAESALPFANCRAGAYRECVTWDPRTKCAPSAATLARISQALTAYEARRPAHGFPSFREQAGAHVAVSHEVGLHGDCYLDLAVTAYERLRSGRPARPS